MAGEASSQVVSTRHCCEFAVSSAPASRILARNPSSVKLGIAEPIRASVCSQLCDSLLSPTFGLSQLQLSGMVARAVTWLYCFVGT